MARTSTGQILSGAWFLIAVTGHVCPLARTYWSLTTGNTSSSLEVLANGARFQSIADAVIRANLRWPRSRSRRAGATDPPVRPLASETSSGYRYRLHAAMVCERNLRVLPRQSRAHLQDTLGQDPSDQPRNWEGVGAVMHGPRSGRIHASSQGASFRTSPLSNWQHFNNPTLVHLRIESNGSESPLDGHCQGRCFMRA
jgi:hypothetical protein